MPKLNKADIRLITNVVKQRKNKVKFGKTWQAIFDEFNVGEVRAEGSQQWLYFDLVARDELQQLCESDTGVSPSFGLPKGIRTDVAGIAIDEKISTESIQQNRIYCSATAYPIYIAGDEVCLPAKSSLWVDFNDISIGKYTRVVVVENLEAFVLWGQFNLSEQLGSSLVVYRGHDVTAKAVISFLNILPIGIDVTVFSDPDPAGLGIIMSTPKVTSALVPVSIEGFKKVSHKERFGAQLATMPNVKEKSLLFSEQFQKYANTIIKLGIAVNQERLCNEKWPLVLINV